MCAPASSLLIKLDSVTYVCVCVCVCAGVFLSVSKPVALWWGTRGRRWVSQHRSHSASRHHRCLNSSRLSHVRFLVCFIVRARSTAGDFFQLAQFHLSSSRCRWVRDIGHSAAFTLWLRLSSAARWSRNRRTGWNSAVACVGPCTRRCRRTFHPVSLLLRANQPSPAHEVSNACSYILNAAYQGYWHQ